MKHLDGEYYVEVKAHQNKIRPTENVFFYGNEIHHNLSEHNIKYKMRLRLEKIRKLPEIIMMNY